MSNGLPDPTMQAPSGRAWVVMPAFNEAVGIAAVVEDVLRWFPNVIVVDDGSKDDTAAQARKAGASVVAHPVNLGQGAALQTGFDWALELGASWVVTLDADGQHQPEDAWAMLQRAQSEGLDVCLGSRFLGRTERMPVSRRYLLKLALRFQNATTGLPLTDVHNGLRVLSRQALGQFKLTQNRMAHASEIVSRMAALKLKIAESPVTIRYTDYSLAKGQSSLGALNILADLLLARLGR